MDLNINRSGDIIEDLLGNDKEVTLVLRDSLKADSRARFRLTSIIAGLIGSLGLVFVFVPFVPGIISLWIMGMAVGMILAAVFGLLFAMPLTDSVSVHLKVIDYVDNVIKNTDYRKRNIMDDDPQEESEDDKEKRLERINEIFDELEDDDEDEEEGPDRE